MWSWHLNLKSGKKLNHRPPGVSQVLVVKNLAAYAWDTRDACLIPGLGRPPAGGHGNPLHYNCLEDLLDREAWWAMVHRLQRVRYGWSDLAHATLVMPLPVKIDTRRWSLFFSYYVKREKISGFKSYILLLIAWYYVFLLNKIYLGFLAGSASKESSCNVGDLGLIPG